MFGFADCDHSGDSFSERIPDLFFGPLLQLSLGHNPVRQACGRQRFTDEMHSINDIRSREAPVWFDVYNQEFARGLNSYEVDNEFASLRAQKAESLAAKPFNFGINFQCFGEFRFEARFAWNEPAILL